MAKYRILTSEELKTFENEFVNYLVVNGIVAEDWEKMKKEESEKAEKIVDLFSDVIMEGVLRKVNFVEIRVQSYIQSIQFMTDGMRMVALSIKDKSVDLRNLDVNAINSDVISKMELHQGEKNYESTRESAIFEFVQRGYEVSDGQLFKTLLLASVE